MNRYAIAEGKKAKRAYAKLSPLAKQILDNIFDFPSEQQLGSGYVGNPVELVMWLIEKIEPENRQKITPEVANRFCGAINELIMTNFLSAA